MFNCDINLVMRHYKVSIGSLGKNKSNFCFYTCLATDCNISNLIRTY